METIIFCHGMPGSTADVDLLRRTNPDAKIIPLRLLEVDPAQIDTGLRSSLDTLLEQSGGERVHLVGFSIGAMAAIKLAALRPDKVSRLTLISPAAPLSLGEFLPNMAGKPIFNLALKSPALLKIVTGLQGWITRISPNLLINMLFSKCGTIEKDLLKDPFFRGVLTQGLSDSLVKKPSSYLSYVCAYVSDWSGILQDVKSPVVLWHGTKDTWSPLEMSEKLENAFGNAATLNVVEDAEHYSTLTRVAL